MTPSLSVLITYYNERELLTECLRSLLEGTEAVDEILIYDDCSASPATDYVPSDPRLKVIRAEKNQGPSVGRNELLSRATSDYVHFHDADDWFHGDWARQVRGALARRNLDAVFTEVSSYRDGEIVSSRVLEINRLESGGDLLSFCLSGSMLVPAGTFRRSLAQALGGYRTDLWQSEDFDFHIRMAAKQISFAVIPEPLVHIRLRAESRSQKLDEVWVSALDAIGRLIKEVPPSHHDRLAERVAAIGSRLFRLGLREKAREAFALANRLGAPRFENQRAPYRWVAHRFGAEAAEWMGLAGRRIKQAIRR